MTMYEYTSKSGLPVTTCNPKHNNGEEDFKTTFHYMYWSYKEWWGKVFLSLLHPKDK